MGSCGRPASTAESSSTGAGRGGQNQTVGQPPLATASAPRGANASYGNAGAAGRPLASTSSAGPRQTSAVTAPRLFRVVVPVLNIEAADFFYADIQRACEGGRRANRRAPTVRAPVGAGTAQSKRASEPPTCFNLSLKAAPHDCRQAAALGRPARMCLVDGHPHSRVERVPDTDVTDDLAPLMNPSSGAGRVDLEGDVIDDSRGYEEVVKETIGAFRRRPRERDGAAPSLQ